MKVLITAGPTREPIDPVRYLTNRSSGKMGYAIANAAAHAGHQVLLISGPTALDVPEGVDFLQIESAEEMYQAVADYLPRMDAGIFAAAVADYTPAVVPEQKIKKSDDSLTLKLVKTKDILGSAREIMGFRGFLVGFAAETENVEENAKLKLQKKGCDLVVANDVSRRDIGFDSSDNEAILVFRDRTELFEKAPKHDLAMYIVSMIGGAGVTTFKHQAS
ncbi:phosphopantothenoylcysteine decarboxylase [Luteolibacter algae]|uniref:Phosphopantothenoylcysteine decarboxylase n=1 Tax=Luteolibacter algae TaxID=454151 RepID=A0ABW5D9K9_9BACT